MLRLVDVSRYQIERARPLDLTQAQTAGYHIANIALTGGRGYISGRWADTYNTRARELGMGVSTYHWLDGRTPGAQQAAATITRLRASFSPDLQGFAHIVDVEETGEHGITPPTWQHVGDYVNAMQQALGRHIAIYSGRWWWHPRGWPGRGLTPWLMGPPMNGYLPAPPEPDAPTWNATFGGWEQLAIMQWGVAELPGTSDCSLSVIRDHGVWADLTGGDALMPQADPGNSPPEAWAGPPASSELLAELDAMALRLTRAATGTDDIDAYVRRLNTPHRETMTLTPRTAGETCAPVIAAELDDWVTLGGASSGCVGNRRHGTGYHRGANYILATDYSRRRDPNGSDGPYINWDWACAGDFHHGGRPALRAMHKTLLALLRAGAFPMICEFIVQPDADKPVMYWARWEGVNRVREYTGSGHDLWSHVSWYRSKANQRPHLWKEVANVATLDNTDKTWLKSAEFTNAVAAAVEKRIFEHKIDPNNPVNTGRTLDTWVKDIQNMRDSLIHALNDTKVQGRPLPGSLLDKLAKSLDTTATSLTALAEQVAAGSRADADRDQAMLTALLAELNEVRTEATDPVSVEDLHAALQRIYGDAFTRAAQVGSGE